MLLTLAALSLVVPVLSFSSRENGQHLDQLSVAGALMGASDLMDSTADGFVPGIVLTGAGLLVAGLLGTVVGLTVFHEVASATTRAAAAWASVPIGLGAILMWAGTTDDLRFT